MQRFETMLATLLLALLPVQQDILAHGHHAIPHATLDTVIIDAGHGGKDPGCKGKKYSEKNVTLAIALKVGKLIQERHPTIRVIYTRDTDVFIPLDDRAKIANDNGADLFISIHCNAVASANTNIAGTETYVMGNHVLEENLAVAKRENESVLFEDGYVQKYDGYDPNSPVSHIVLSMFQSAHQERSMAFAANIEKQFASAAKRKSRGVHQAGFLVLRKTAMPSVLIETGYLTNPTEELFLGSLDGQNKIAEAIYEAFRIHKAETEGQPKPAAAKPAKPVGPPVLWYIQLASSETALAIRDGAWKKVPQVSTERSGKFYIYLTGYHESYETALEGQDYWRRNGFPDAFVVPYREGKRITLEEAR